MRHRNFVTILCGLGIICGGLALWTWRAETMVHYTPDYEKADIFFCLEQGELSEEDYELILAQTGLGRAAVDALRQQAAEVSEDEEESGTGEQSRSDIQRQLSFLQKRFLEEVSVSCEPNTAVTRLEILTDVEEPPEGCSYFPNVEDGDILVTFNCHFLGWRSGHAGIVVDAEEGLVLEATSFGSRSKIFTLERWGSYPSVAVLRLKGASSELRREIADYARSGWVDRPYTLRAGKEEGTEGSGTQCAHLIWAVYQHYGFDLDGDGGWIVTPHDLFSSSGLEVVQIYGINPADIDRR